ncbi:MAG: protein kinase [Candidatus Aminicenantes bacterium]|jgi:serine/threonine protein kinase/tetratricopeptide (TPR) repeat protein
MTVECPKCHTKNPDSQKYCGECASPLPHAEVSPTKTLETPTQELTTGSTYAGRYQIIEELGKGGMGKVYRVLDKELDEEVALKLIKPEIATDNKTVERFKSELKLARKISHKNVGRMYELLEEKGNRFITMEYVPGEDLKSFIRRSGQLTVGTMIRIAKQVCEGMAEAHRLGVVHRDLKPSNIMIDKEGNARIMDFGIARSIKEKGITGAGVMIGTPEYMSPEQVEAKEVDLRSDIYSLGVILYEMLTGRLPFEGETPLAIAMKHKGKIPENPKELNPNIPDDLGLAILKCLEKEKENRYQSAVELRSELERIEQGLPTTDRVVPKRKTPTSKEITVTFGVKKWIVPVLVVFALVVIGLLIWSPWAKKDTLPKESEKVSIAVLPFEDLSPEKDLGQFCGGIADHIISKLLKLKANEWRIPNWPSAMQYQNSDKTLNEIGRELNVSNLLTGTARKEEEDISVMAKLIDPQDDTIIWQEVYDRKLKEIFKIQSDIAGEIVIALKVELSPEEKLLLQKNPTENLKAYDRYTLGRWYWNKRTAEAIEKSIECYEQATAIDPDYALAYAGMADSLVALQVYGLNYGMDEVIPRAKQAAQKALEIDDTLAEAHSALAMVFASVRNIEDAEREFKRAIALNPHYAHAHHWYAYMLVHLGRTDEALEHINRAHELDPHIVVISKNVGLINFYARNYDRAIEAANKTIEMDLDYIPAYDLLWRAYLANSMFEKALLELEQRKEKLGENLALKGQFGLTYALMGKKEHAEQILSELIETSEQVSLKTQLIANLYFALGDIDKGFNWLGKSIPLNLLVNPLYDNIRGDPRYAILLKKMGLD